MRLFWRNAALAESRALSTFSETAFQVMDYDATEIPRNYDRGRDHGPALLELWMNVVTACSRDVVKETIVDLGCGTGRFTDALANYFGANVIGIDPSAKMLEQARAKPHNSSIRYELGSAESIPLPDQSVDLIFMSMIFHHFIDPKLAARECRRVLRHGGKAFLRAGTREHISSYPFVPFFPESLPLLETRLPAQKFVCDTFESAGFKTAKMDIVTQQIAETYDEYADKLAAGADSVLASLSKQQFDTGLESLRAHAKRHSSEAVVEPIDVFVFS